MKIGISCYPTYGGSGVVATELGLKLAERGHEVHFISYAQPMRLDFRPNVYFHEVEVPSYPLMEYPPYSLALASRMADTATSEGLELIHCHYALPHAASAYLAKQMVAPRPLGVVTTLHGTDITLVGNEPSFLPITRFSIERSDAVTAVSDSLRQRTLDEFAIATPIHVVHNFVDAQEFRRTCEPDCSRMVSPHDEKILVHVSNFRPVKRIQDVVAVFARVRPEVPSRLLLVGDGPERKPTENLVRELGLAPHVVFLGKQSQLPPILSCADLFLLTSDSESFGLAALEAMACEVPVVGARAGGLPEVVEHGVTGYLEPVGDVDAMARDAIALLRDDAARESMAKAARARAVQLFDPDAIVGQYEAIYRDVVAKIG